MDAATIDRVMWITGLASDPAFDALTFMIELIPPAYNGYTRGLYFPDTRTIVLPPQGDESVLLHELGHRYGDYYYGDLSEGFAEAFRLFHERLRAGLTA